MKATATIRWGASLLALACSSHPRQAARPAPEEDAAVTFDARPTDGGSGRADTASAGAARYTPPRSNRAEVDLDEGWRFVRSDATGAEAPGFDDGAWAAIRLPHTWNNLDGQDGGGNYYRGPGWYRRHYRVPAELSGRRLFLQFDAASITADVYVNGRHVGQHKGAFAAFRFDVSADLAMGRDNVIAVRVSNAGDPDVPTLGGDFNMEGGLYRPVHLLAVDPVHIDVEDFASPGVYLSTRDVTAQGAELSARVALKNADGAAHAVTVVVNVVQPDGTLFQRISAEQTLAAGAAATVPLVAKVTAPHLWNGRLDPYVYTAHVELREAGAVRDLVSEPLGFRSFSVDANEGFRLNGQPYDLHGANRHQDWWNDGWAIGRAQHQEDMDLLLEMGATTVRLCHYQHAREFHHLADRSGLVVWSELGLVNGISTSAAFTASARQQLTELIRQNFNHPSIVFWSLSNELLGGPDYVPLTTELNALAHQEDPGRLTTLATNNPEGAPITHVPDAIAYNRYYGWYYGKSEEIAAWLDKLHQSFPAHKLALSEYGAGASPFIHATAPVAFDYSEEHQAQVHEAYWKALSARKYLWGKFVWQMFDSASDGRKEADQPGRNNKGLVTADRKIRKDAFYWYKANWTTAPFVHITSRRFDRRTTPSIDIKVYANTSSVELLVRGKSLGARTSPDHVFVWPGVALQPGENAVKAIGSGGVSDEATFTLVPAPDGGVTDARGGG
jgi:beta-galactosidase